MTHCKTSLTAALLAISLAAPVGLPALAGEPLALLMATGSTAGVYHPLGTAMATIWSREIDDLTVESDSSGGSVVNVRLIEQGAAQLALIQTDIASYAVAAEEMFAGGPPLAANRGVAVLYPEPIQIVTLAGSGIERVGDLAGKRVAVGPRDSGTELNARQILAVHGLDYGSVNAALMPFEDAVVALRDGYIDAAFLTAGVPTRAVSNITALYGQDVALVPLEPERVEEIVARWPYYTPMVIPGETYPKIEAATATVAVNAMLVASAELDDATVERLLDNLYSGPTLSRLCGAHRRGCDIDRAKALAGMPIPLHPGARAFHERAVVKAVGID